MLPAEKRGTRWVVCLSLIFCFLLILSIDSYGQKKEYPERAIEIIVGTAPGGMGDLYVRAWSDDFSKLLKVPVVISNKAGASGMTALIEASGARKDGYTLTYFTMQNLLGYALCKFPFDIFKDFTPIGSWGNYPNMIVVEKSSPFKTYEEVMDYARKNPGKLKCASAGAMGSGHFNFLLLMQQAKVNITMVPFKGTPPAATALLGNHVDLYVTAPTSVMGLLKAGRVRGLAATQRIKEFPDIPLFSEKGISSHLATWVGLFSPSGVPKENLKKLIDTFEKLTKDPKVTKRLEDLGYTPDYIPPTTLSEQMKGDFETIKTVAEQAGITCE